MIREGFGRYVMATIRRRLLPPLRRRYDTMDLSQSVFREVLRDLPRFEDRGEPAFVRWLAIKSENKTRSFPRAAMHPGINAQRSVHARQACLPNFNEFEPGPPHQRPVSEHPDVTTVQ